MPQKKIDRLLSIPIVKNIVRKKIVTAMGLRDAKIVATGAAITPAFLKDWYKKLGIHLVEAYGMTEVCGSISNSPRLDSPADSVGEVVPYCKVKVDQETEEILMYSPWVMTGYYKDPELTAKVIKDGWMHSGDKGTLDENGFLRVVGRVKDAFKTSKGQFITPNPMEEVLSKNDFIEQVCVAGIGIPQPIVLVNLSEIGQRAQRNELEENLQEELVRLNASLSGYQKISTLIIDQTAWTEDNELLTPTLKVRRGKLNDRYAQRYLEWHEKDDQIIWEKQMA